MTDVPPDTTREQFNGILPDRETCVKMIEDPDNRLLPEKKKHIYKVNELSRQLGEELAQTGLEIDHDLLDRASLLHDTKKGLDTGDKHHADVAADFIRESGWDEKLARTVAFHSSVKIDEARDTGWEAAILNYTDRRVDNKTGKVISLLDWRDGRKVNKVRASFESIEALENEMKERGVDLDKIFKT